nr:uncharacterized protein LOC111990491 isoform X2 [Quercus suber]
MGRNGEGESVARTSSSSSAINRHSHANTKNTVLRTRPDPFLIVCRCFSVITALTAVLCIAVNVFSAIRSFKDGSDIFDGIFRCYAVVIACFVVLAETEWKFVMKSCKVLEYWAARGMLQILDFYALATSNVFDNRKQLQGIKQSRIWRIWSDVERNLNNYFLWKGWKGSETTFARVDKESPCYSGYQRHE